ncbi:MAG: hypothetical protein ACLTMV_03940, partial [Thomasclavelia spiroformis]
LIYYFWLHFHAGKCQLMQSIFPKENADKALKYRLYRHLPAYEKIIRNLVSFYYNNSIKNPLIKYLFSPDIYSLTYLLLLLLNSIPNLYNKSQLK